MTEENGKTVSLYMDPDTLYRLNALVRLFERNPKSNRSSVVAMTIHDAYDRYVSAFRSEEEANADAHD